MQDILSYLSNIRRPRLLVRAARIGAPEYRREYHLSRLIGGASLPRSAEALLRLSEIEAELNQLRLEEDASYSLIRHIDVLIALVAESRLMRATLAHAAAPGGA